MRWKCVTAEPLRGGWQLAPQFLWLALLVPAWFGAASGAAAQDDARMRQLRLLAAEALARRAIREYAGNPRPYLTLAAALGQLGRAEEARTALGAAIAVSPSIFKFLTDSRPPYYRPVDHDHLIDGVRKAGWERA